MRERIPDPDFTFHEIDAEFAPVLRVTRRGSAGKSSVKMNLAAAASVSDGSDKLFGLRQEIGGRLGSRINQYSDDLAAG